MILRPDAKGRVGLESLTRILRERLGGQPISGYAAEITPDGALLLHPRIEVEAAEAATLVLGAQDRDALLAALASPPKPTPRLREAARRHRRKIAGP
jgi:hypothetical protein